MEMTKKYLTDLEKDILKEIKNAPGITLREIAKIFKPWSVLLLSQLKTKNIIHVDEKQKIKITSIGLELLE
jgi:hypothetical protein